MRTAFICTLALVACVPTAAEGQTIYNIVSYEPDQAGHSISGTITTDGTIGQLSMSNILGWEWTVGSFTGSMPNSPDDWLLLGQVEATPTGILMDWYSDVVLAVDTGSEYVQWGRGDPNAGPYNSQVYCAWLDGSFAWFNNSPWMDGTDPWVIAEINLSPVDNTSWGRLKNLFR